MNQSAQQWGQNNNGRGSDGWLSGAFQIIVKTLALTLRQEHVRVLSRGITGSDLSFIRAIRAVGWNTLERNKKGSTMPQLCDPGQGT